MPNELVKIDSKTECGKYSQGKTMIRDMKGEEIVERLGWPFPEVTQRISKNYQ